jgi:uncharacterized membrane protein YfcA
MPMDTLALIACALCVVAFLYSCVGHAGASGYIAVLTLCGLAAPEVKPIALILNILVACIGAAQFWRAAAYVGGKCHIPDAWLKALLGLVLLYSAARFAVRQGDPAQVTPPAKPVAVGVGAGIGFLSGLTGTGGGIFLTPIMLFCRWAHTRQVAAVSVVFILVNSASGLAGHISGGKPMPTLALLWPLAVAVIVGGALGSYFGSRKCSLRVIHAVLAVVLLVAGGKLLWEGLAGLRG